MTQDMSDHSLNCKKQRKKTMSTTTNLRPPHATRTVFDPISLVTTYYRTNRRSYMHILHKTVVQIDEINTDVTVMLRQQNEENKL